MRNTHTAFTGIPEAEIGLWKAPYAKPTPTVQIPSKQKDQNDPPEESTSMPGSGGPILMKPVL
jgi:hypothetical protein